MRRNITILILFLTITLSLNSCITTKIHELQSNCDQITTDELFKSLTTLVLKENMIIKQSDAKLGYLQAETNPKRSPLSGETRSYAWVFQHSDGKIVAYAKVLYSSQNAFGATKESGEAYYGDDSSKEEKWYWNVRNGIEKLCGNKIIIVTTKKPMY